MKKVNLNVVAVILAVIAAVGLVEGQLVIFLGFLALSGMILGAERMMKLEEDENAVKSIKKTNLRLAVIGVVFAVLSNTGIGVMDLLASFAFGTSFGLIGVNMIFENSKK